MQKEKNKRGNKSSAATKSRSAVSESDKLVDEYWKKLRANKPKPKKEETALVKADTTTMKQVGAVLHSSDHMMLAKIGAALTLHDITDNKYTQISACRRTDQAGTENTIKLLLAEFAESFNVARNLTPAQIEEITAEIIVNYWHLSFEDLVLFTKRVKRGDYGTIYHLDVNKILTFLADYDKERLALIQQKQQQSRDMDAPRASVQEREKQGQALAMYLTTVKPKEGKKEKK